MQWCYSDDTYICKHPWHDVISWTWCHLCKFPECWTLHANISWSIPNMSQMHIKQTFLYYNVMLANLWPTIFVFKDTFMHLKLQQTTTSKSRHEQPSLLGTGWNNCLSDIFLFYETFFSHGQPNRAIFCNYISLDKKMKREKLTFKNQLFLTSF